ncbi:hypothetical protein ACQCT3_02265 [Sutcliffiella horikoshii]|uniref:hypothetical protein n=1 Tax=Sutcliffiella horikoshii TaxID=79883 RepID=UPI003CF506A5
MIITSMLIGAAIIAGGSLIKKFWNNILSWLKRAVQKIKQIVKLAVYGTKVFIEKIGSAFREISKHYSKKENNQWVENIVTREVSASEVPPEIRAMAQQRRETDITSELQLELVS